MLKKLLFIGSNILTVLFAFFIMKTEVYAAGGQVNISEAKVGQIYDVDTVFVNDTGKVVYIGYEDEYD